MWTGRLLLLVLLLLNIQTACAETQPEQDSDKPLEAWWLTTELQAQNSNVNGKPISEINSNWKRVTVLNNEYVKNYTTKDEYQHLKNSPLSFKLKASIDDNPQEEEFITGVYESNSGEKGRFVAILSGTEIVKYFEHSGYSGYSALLKTGNSVQWYKCMECGDYDTITWTGTGYALE